MTNEMRKTGIDVVGDVPWGTHFCLFYETKDDILDTLVSYCKAGLESEEFCLWVVSEPVTVDEAKHALNQAVPELDRYLAGHSIEIVSAREWYLQDGTFDLKRVIGAWHEQLARALASGYTGVRVTGDTACSKRRTGRTFANTKRPSTSRSPISAWPCCAPTRSPRAGRLKSWMWCVPTSLPQQSDTGVGTSSKPPGSSKPRPKSSD